MEAEDGVVRRFSSVMHAVSWAYETLERAPAYAQPTMYPSEKRGGGYPPEDYQDLAYTILTALGSMEDQQAAGMLRAMGGEPQARGYWLTTMAGEIASVIEWPVQLERRKQCGMAMVSILRITDEHDNPRKERNPSCKEYAKIANVSNESIHQRKRWVNTRHRLEDVARQLRDQGINELGAALTLMGMLRG